MRIAVCDDIIMEQEQMVQALHTYDPTRKPECFDCGKDLLAAAAKMPPFDIAFLDIYMPGENGVDIAGDLQKVSPSTEIVFVTTSTDHAVDAFHVRALHYLVKPVTAEGVTEAFRRLVEARRKKRPMISFSSGADSDTVYIDEISYIQSVDHAKEVILTSGRVIKVWMPMEELTSKLNDSFLKLNRSIVVNMEQIERMNKDSCVLRNGIQLDFARRERAAIKAAYDDYLFSRLMGG